MDDLTPLELAQSDRAREQLAKDWILDLVERTPLADLPEVRMSWLARHAAPLVGDILGALADPEVDVERLLDGAPARRAAELATLHRGDAAVRAVPRDLAVLQALVIETLRRDVPEREPGDFSRSLRRLTEAFGVVQASVTEALVIERTGAVPDELTGLPGQAELHEWLQVMFAEYRRYGHPFSIMLIDVEGLDRINGAYGRGAADRMLAAIAGVIRSQVRSADRTFRRAGGEFCVLAPHHEAAQVRPLAERLIEVVESSQEDREPRLAIAIGVGACPQDADDPERLLEVTEEAAFSAKANGHHLALAGAG